jgi:hypothetical protein
MTWCNNIRLDTGDLPSDWLNVGGRPSFGLGPLNVWKSMSREVWVSENCGGKGMMVEQSLVGISIQSSTSYHSSVLPEVGSDHPWR